MSILKQKIKACKEAQQRKQTLQKEENSPPSSTHSKTDNKQQISSKGSNQNKKRQRLKGDSVTPKCYLEAKNIVTNFGKAIATFAMSDLAKPYLLAEIQRKNYEDLIQPKEFVEFVKDSKGNINSIDSLRNLLLVEPKDSPRTVAAKKCFQSLAEVFIKCFSVNWIIHGRVTYKLEHLKFRFRMLRRIKNPEVFTYLKGYNDKKKSGSKSSRRNSKKEDKQPEEI